MAKPITQTERIRRLKARAGWENQLKSAADFWDEVIKLSERVDKLEGEVADDRRSRRAGYPGCD